MWVHLRAAAVMGVATTAILSMAGCASHQVPAGGDVPAPRVTASASQSPPQAPTQPMAQQASAPEALPPELPAVQAQQQLSASATDVPASSPSIETQVLPSAPGQTATLAIPVLPPASAPPSVIEPFVGSLTNAPAASPASDASDASPASDASALSVARHSKRLLLAAYESKLWHDRAVVSAYQRERRHQPSLERSNDRSYFLRRMLQDGLMRLSEPELLEWAQLQRSLADRGATGTCSGMRSPQNALGQAMSINALSVDEVALYLGLSYQAIHDAAVGKPFRMPSKWRVQAAQINLAAQVVALIAQHPEDAKRLAIFEAEGEKKTAANRCWMAALGMRAALRLRDPDRDIILRTLVQRDAR